MVSAAAGPAAASAVLDQDGCGVITGAISDAAVGELLDEIASFEEAPGKISSEEGEDAFYAGDTKRTTALVTKSAAARSLVTKPAILDQAGRYLLPSCDKFQ
eukprot:SAG22_NODE_487_length_9870_cov_13.118821_5_plen_102_part_00